MPAGFQQHIVITPINFVPAMLWLRQTPSAADRCIRLAIMDTNERTRVEIVRAIRREYTITRASLLDQSHRARMKIRKINPKMLAQTSAGTAPLRGGVEVSSARLPIMRFQVSPRSIPVQLGVPVANRKTLTLSQVRGVSYSRHPNLFLAQMKSGHLGVYRRDASAKSKGKGSARTALPIDEQFMISPAEMVRGKRIFGPLQKFMTQVFDNRLMHHIQRWMKTHP